MTAYASGKYSKATCDRCGGVYAYGALKEEYKNHQRTGLLTCIECWDGEHPQDVPTKHRPDPQALRHPRPRLERVAEGDSTANNAFGPPDGEDYEAWARTQV